MIIKAYREIDQEHVKADSNWLPFDLQRDDGHSSLVYYPKYMTVKKLTDAVKHVRQNQKMHVIHVPFQLPKDPFHRWMWSFERNNSTRPDAITSELTMDLRDEQTRHLQKFNDAISTLNPEVAAVKNPPEFIHRQAYGVYDVHHLWH